ncbi:MAG: hypothetical protein JJ971_11595 [Balneolaceae bacterium]|nr:hypothetical protein [Balneolaceae bacterium]MBO6547507.1 hypothetical protein [Balneolaceae bacterium]MBO6647546.1 hypothetical protein [Balneolaceae bacterium]
MASSNPNIYLKLGFFVISIVYSFFLIGLALVFLAGAGHGWVSTVYASTLIIISLPIASFSWIYRRTDKGKKYSKIAIIIALVADILLLSLTYFEGFDRAFFPFQYGLNEEIGLVIFSWYLLWCIWQFITFTLFGLNLKQRGV